MCPTSFHLAAPIAGRPAWLSFFEKLPGIYPADTAQPRFEASSGGASCSCRLPPQLVLAQARDVDFIQRRDDKIGVCGRQELLVVGSGYA